MAPAKLYRPGWHFFGVVLPTVLVYWPAGTTLQLSPGTSLYLPAGHFWQPVSFDSSPALQAAARAPVAAATTSSRTSVSSNRRAIFKGDC